jgi:hypothetical protein
VSTVNVTDNPTIGETITRMLLAFPAILNEALTLGESLTRQLLAFPSVSDAATLGETITKNLLFFPAITNEAVTVGETITTQIPFIAMGIVEAIVLDDPDSITVMDSNVIGALALMGVGL